MILRSYRWKWKKNFTRDFFKLSKINLLYGCFDGHATFCRWFSGENKEENNNIARNSSKSDILIFLKLVSHGGDELHRPSSSPDRLTTWVFFYVRKDVKVKCASKDFCWHLYHMESHFVLFPKLYRKVSESKSIGKSESIISMYKYNVNAYNLTGII